MSTTEPLKKDIDAMADLYDQRIVAARDELQMARANAKRYRESLKKEVEEGGTTGNPKKDQMIYVFGLKTLGYNNFMRFIESVKAHAGEPILVVEQYWAKNIPATGPASDVFPKNRERRTASVEEEMHWAIYSGTLTGDQPEVKKEFGSSNPANVFIPTGGRHSFWKVRRGSRDPLRATSTDLQKAVLSSMENWAPYFDSMWFCIPDDEEDDVQEDHFFNNHQSAKQINIFIGNEALEGALMSASFPEINAISSEVMMEIKREVSTAGGDVLSTLKDLALYMIQFQEELEPAT